MLEDQTQIEAIDENEAAPVEAEAEDQDNTIETEQSTEPEAQTEEQRTVPYQALHEEREKRKRESERNARLEERLDGLMKRLAESPEPQAKPPAEDELPEPDPEDVAGVLIHKLTKLERWQQKQLEREQEMQRAQSERSQLSGVLEHARSEATRYASEQPDYPQAYQHYRESRRQELETLGITGQQAELTMNREELGLMARAQQRGLSAPQMIHDLARQRGYAPAPMQAPMTEPKAKKEPPRSVSGMAGKPSGGKLTAEKLLSMPEGEYFKLLKQDPDKIRAIMNGGS